MKKKAVIFDLDGTLIDSSEGITKCVQYALEHFGIREKDQAELRKFIGPPLSDSFMRYYGFLKEDALEAVSYYRERYRDVGIFECKLYPGVKECLKKLKDQGYQIALASSKPGEFCNRILEHFDVRYLFDYVVGSTMDGSIETKEQVLRELFSLWPDVSREQMVLVGDTLFDVNGAKQVGIDCIVVGYGFGNVEKMLEAGAQAVCYDILVVPDVIARE